MLTFQDFEKIRDTERPEWLMQAIKDYKNTDLYQTAVTADLYDRQQNKTINEYVQTIFTLTGARIADFTASNARIASNFFRRLNTQRCTYSLGNGVSFTEHHRKDKDPETGLDVDVDETKERLGPKFDNDLTSTGYYSLIHGVCFGYLTEDRVIPFKATEFVPLWDEVDGTLRAGIRFWQLDDKKPMTVVLYERDGITRYRTKESTNALEEIEPKHSYKITVQKAPADDRAEVITEENYSDLPIIPLWGSRLHQSTLIGMQQGIDSYDLIRSGFANDLTDCSQIYWLIENCGGMSDAELARVRDRMKLNHIVTADTDEGGRITPYTQEIPYEARKVYLQHIREGIYEDFGGLDVHTVAAGATNDHIDAAYQPLDENADDFEYQVIEFVQSLLRLEGIDDTPVFKRNRISNQKEQVEMVIMEAPYLDDETILSKLPNITPDEVQGILARRDVQDADKFELKPAETIEDVVV